MLTNFKNTALVAVVGLGLSACANDYFTAKDAAAPSDRYGAALYKEMMAIATFESKEQDWADANYHASRALTVANGGSIELTPPSQRSLAPNFADELNPAHDALAKLLADGAGNQDPSAASKAFAGYECWLEQAEEGFQTDDIAACKKQFEDAMSLLAAPAPVAMMSDGGPWMVFFPTNGTTVSAEGMNAVMMAANAAASGGTLLLRGYADSVGSEAYNMDLSKRRAMSVADLLGQKGVSQDSMNVGYVGESEQLIETKDGVAEQGNRVVVMRLIQ